jgi:hypothetical protein
MQIRTRADAGAAHHAFRPGSPILDLVPQATAMRARSLRFAILATSSVLLARPAAAQGSGRGRLEGTVTDSVHARPFAGVHVVAASAHGRAESRVAAATDTSGRFHIDSLPLGRYLVGFESPLLDSLEITVAPQEVSVSEGRAAQVELALPPATKLRSAICSGATLPADKGVLYGHVVDATTEAPLAGAVITAVWRELTIDKKTLRPDNAQRVASVKTDSTGWYRLCGVPTGTRVSFLLQYRERSSPVVRAVVDDTLGILIRHLSLDTTGPIADAESADTLSASAMGTARLAGVVRGTGGAPLASAELRVLGTRATARTDATGAYSIANLPAGTQLLEVRHIGYAAVEKAFELRSGETVVGDVELQRVVNLDSIRVVAVRSRYSEFNEHRRNTTFGVFLDPDAMSRQHDPWMSDVIMKIPGFAVAGEGPNAKVVSSRGVGSNFCSSANVVIDGMPNQSINDVNPFMVGSVEAYREGEPTPPEYFDHKGCGMIVIWTKR